MRGSVPLRWIEEAEARSARDIARLNQAEARSRDGVASTMRSGAPLLERLRGLLHRLVWTSVGLLSHRIGVAVGVPARLAGASGDSSGEVDADRVLVTVLITDIVESTKRVAEIGDRHWRELLDRHDDAARQQLKRFGGRVVNNRGDGFLATFDSPARAVRCATAIAETITGLGISVRRGVHVGEIYLRRDEISGIAVHIAARIAAIANPGEAFVSKTVRDLTIGSGLTFEDRGIHQLRGVPEEIHLYAMRAAAGNASTTCRRGLADERP